MPARAWSDRKVEQLVGNLLRAGVVLASVVVLAGGLIELGRHGSAPLEFRVFRGEPADLRGVGGIMRDAASLEGRGLIQLGLLLLLATPVARVALLVFAFARERDRLYVAVTLAVLAVLLYSLLAGR